jgi:hypothetical protein
MSIISFLPLAWIALLATQVGVFLLEVMAGGRVVSCRLSTDQLQARDSRAS